MHQNLAIILRQLWYGKISFIVLVPVMTDPAVADGTLKMGGKG